MLAFGFLDILSAGDNSLFLAGLNIKQSHIAAATEHIQPTGNGMGSNADRFLLLRFEGSDCQDAHAFRRLRQRRGRRRRLADARHQAHGRNHDPFRSH